MRIAKVVSDVVNDEEDLYYFDDLDRRAQETALYFAGFWPVFQGDDNKDIIKLLRKYKVRFYEDGKPYKSNGGFSQGW
ncbi:MAG: hypothetical protein FWE89_02280 [Syntrophaceae bacterium]|nr:hypothetical protein [Syntrophaceae bacterium]